MISKEKMLGPVIKGIFEAAQITCRINERGEVIVTERYVVFVTTNQMFVTFRTMFGLIPVTSKEVVLETVNRTNILLHFVRAFTVDGDGPNLLIFEMNWLLDDEVSREKLIDALHLFQLCVERAEPNFKGLI